MAALTEEQRELILELAENEELTKAEIARRAGVSRPTVYKVFREAGLDESVSEEEDDEETYAEGGETPDGVQEDGETEEETEEEDYAELTDEEERRVLKLYEQSHERLYDLVGQELKMGREEAKEAVGIAVANSIKDDLEDADEEPPVAPTRAGMLLVGGLLGAGALYLTLMRGLIPYPQPGQIPGSSSGSGSPGVGSFPGPPGGPPGSSGIGR